MEYKDYYKVLGIKKSDDAATIKKAYRSLSKKYHPDQNDAAESEEKFKEINEAYQVLSDSEKKQQYDLLGQNYRDGQNFRPPPGWGENQGGGGGFSDIFEQFFQQQNGGGFGGGNPYQQSRPRTTKGSAIEIVIHVSLDQIYHGSQHSVRFQTRRDRGHGRQEYEQKSYEVTIPAGIFDGDKIRLRGKGNPSDDGGPQGDLILTVKQKKHDIFSSDKFNLSAKLPISIQEAVLGGKIAFQTLDSKINLSIPPLSSSGKKLRLKNKGLRKNKTERGHLDIELQIVLPATLTEEELAFYKESAIEHPFDPRDELKAGTHVHRM